MSNIKKLLVRQMSMTKPHIELGFSKYLYISFYKSYKFFTQYTSYEVPYIANSSTQK
jgi:hypothetical protein